MKKYLTILVLLSFQAFASGNMEALKKSSVLEFHKSPPVTKKVTKFGGQPVWLEEPSWPVSKKTGKPMQFIGQIKITNNRLVQSGVQMAYIFMTDVKGEFVDGTYSAEGGENAVILQPGNIPSFLKVINSSTGPSIDQEFTVHATALIEPFQNYTEFEIFINALPEEVQEQFRRPYAKTKIGGTPIYIQGEETPPGEGWEFLLQINSQDVPFFINFGDAGKAYIYINTALQEGRMLWQCS